MTFSLSSSNFLIKLNFVIIFSLAIMQLYSFNYVACKKLRHYVNVLYIKCTLLLLLIFFELIEKFFFVYFSF